MSSRRVYPKKPLVGVGILIRQGDKYLLIQRAAEPDKGLWSVPGGMIEIGERSTEAAVREVYEETGLVVEILRILDVIDKIIMDENKVKFHFVIVDYIAEYKSGTLKASSDALNARWVTAEEFRDYELSPTLMVLLKKIGLYS